MYNIQELCNAAEGIKHDYGTDKAMGYLIGEKFYNVLKQIHYLIEKMHYIETERTKPGYNPIRKYKYSRKTYEENLDEIYKKSNKDIEELRKEKELFACEIKKLFFRNEIEGYLKNVYAFGAVAHNLSEDVYKKWRENGVLDNTASDDARDVLIAQEIRKLLL